MTTNTRRAATGVAVLGTVTMAHAHSMAEGVGGFGSGFLHPLLELPHLMAVITLALLIGQRGFGPTQPAMVSFGVGLAAGLLVAAAGFAQASQAWPLAAAAVMGALVAIGRPWPRAVYGLAAFFAGAAIGLGSMPEASAPGEAAAALSGTFFGACIWVADGALLAARVRRPWGLVLMRVAASWVTAAALLVLTLRWA